MVQKDWKGEGRWKTVEGFRKTGKEKEDGKPTKAFRKAEKEKKVENRRMVQKDWKREGRWKPTERFRKAGKEKQVENLENLQNGLERLEGEGRWKTHRANFLSAKIQPNTK